LNQIYDYKSNIWFFISLGGIIEGDWGDEMKRRFMALILILILIIPGIASADQQVYQVVGDSNFPPYEYVDANGDFKGFNVDVLKAISLVTGLEFEFTPMLWSVAYNAIDKGKADIIRGMKESEERREHFLFSDSLLMNSQSIFVLDKTTDIKGLKDLSGKTVALNVQEILYKEISEIPDVTIIEYSTFGAALSDLLVDKVDALIGNTLTINYLVNEKDAIEKIKIVGDTLNEQKYSMAVSKNNKELVEKLNKGLAEIQKSGLYDSLYRKWFGTPIKNTKTRYDTLLNIVFAISVGLLVVVLIFRELNRRLKEIIEQKTEEQKALMHELRNYDKLQFMQKIISSIAHEIRNPMTSIRIYTSQMKEKIENKEFMLAAAEDIPTEIDRMDGLIKEFMEYISPRRPILSNVNLYEELMSSLKLIKMQAKGIDIVVDVEKNTYIHFDMSQFKQLIINIVLNSIDAVKNVDKPQLEISAREEDDSVILQFKDNGCGMEEEGLQYIFEPFYTTKELGNGVGMFVVKQIVDENGGNIWAESDGVGEGMLIGITVGKGEGNEE
jgi:ABC-type amino acid transport substrate-binding protein